MMSQESQTPGSRDTEISSWPCFQGMREKGRESRTRKHFFGSEVQRKWLGLVFKLCLWRETRSVCEIYFDELSTRQTWFTHKWKISVFGSSVFSLPEFWSKKQKFFHIYSTDFTDYFVSALFEEVMILLFGLKSLETNRFGLWRTFAHLSKWLSSE